MASLSGLRVAPGNIGVLIVLNEVSNFWSKTHRYLLASYSFQSHESSQPNPNCKHDHQHQLQQEDDKIDFMQVHASSLM